MEINEVVWRFVDAHWNDYMEWCGANYCDDDCMYNYARLHIHDFDDWCLEVFGCRFILDEIRDSNSWLGQVFSTTN